MVLDLIGTLTAPNGARMGVSGMESRGGADYGVGLARWVPEWAEKNGDAGRTRPVWGANFDFFKFDSNF